MQMWFASLKISYQGGTHILCFVDHIKFQTFSVMRLPKDNEQGRKA